MGSRKKTHGEFLSEVITLVGDDYTFLDNYTGCHSKMKVRHEECNYAYLVRAAAFLNGSRCPKCFGSTKKTSGEFAQEVRQLVGDEYSLIDDYVNAKTKMNIKHMECGHIYSVAPNHFLRGKRCPNCPESKSKGELSISNALTKHGVHYECQYKSLKCKNKRMLPFDYVVFKGSEVAALIEYDGELHYIAKDFFGGESALRETQRRDAIKTKYCADNGIPLIRIPYWEFDNIDEILTRELLPLIDKSNAS